MEQPSRIDHQLQMASSVLRQMESKNTLPSLEHLPQILQTSNQFNLAMGKVVRVVGESLDSQSQTVVIDAVVIGGVNRIYSVQFKFELNLIASGIPQHDLTKITMSPSPIKSDQEFSISNRQHHHMSSLFHNLVDLREISSKFIQDHRRPLSLVDVISIHQNCGAGKPPIATVDNIPPGYSKIMEILFSSLPDDFVRNLENLVVFRNTQNHDVQLPLSKCNVLHCSSKSVVFCHPYLPQSVLKFAVMDLINHEMSIHFLVDKSSQHIRRALAVYELGMLDASVAGQFRAVKSRLDGVAYGCIELEVQATPLPTAVDRILLAATTSAEAKMRSLEALTLQVLDAGESALKGMHSAHVLHRDVKVDQFVVIADDVVRSHRFPVIFQNVPSSRIMLICMLSIWRFVFFACFPVLQIKLNDFDLSISIDDLEPTTNATPRIAAFWVTDLPSAAYDCKHDWLNLFLTCLMVWRRGITLEHSSVSAASSASSPTRLAASEIDEKSQSVSQASILSWKPLSFDELEKMVTHGVDQLGNRHLPTRLHEFAAMVYRSFR